MLSRVVLPDPFGPISAVTRPGLASSDTSDRAAMPPNRLDTESTSRVAPDRAAVSRSRPARAAGSTPPPSLRRMRATRREQIPESPSESRTPNRIRNAPSTASVYCWNDDTRSGPSWSTIAPTTAPYTLVDPPSTEAASTAMVVVMVNGPGFDGETKWLRLANKTPAIPHGTAPSAYAFSFSGRTPMPSDDASTGLRRSTSSALPWREVTRLRNTANHKTPTTTTNR